MSRINYHNIQEPAGKLASETTMSKIVADFREHVEKGLAANLLDPNTLVAIVDGIRHSDCLDDRKFLLEHVLIILSKLPPESTVNKNLENAVVELLYNDLRHPPATYVSSQYAFRTADGSYNNVQVPEMGKAGLPYSRSVQQTHPLPNHMLPDAGLVFDTLLKREKFVKHPAGLSSLMFSWAALVIHTCFRTNHRDWTINETSSYVDLSPLYGHNQKAQDMVRVRDGRGLLHPDAFAEDRLMLLPPAVCVLLVLFNRNHNYIARKILSINERGTWTDDIASLSKDKLIQQDEEIFQTTRLINCGWFAGIVFSDYFSAILGLEREGSSWSLNPFKEIRKSNHEVVERGMGNACSVEFNCLYRWHATTSVKDEKWIAMQIEEIFPGKNPEDITPQDFGAAMVKIKAMEPDCEHWTFGSLKRQEDGSFKNEDLASVLQAATSEPASAFKARGTPSVMKLHETMGIEQSRRWGCCSLNDFRVYLGLKPYASFLEWNPNPEIAEAASKLYYGDINNLELYVGLQAEEAKPVMEGAGLCPGYTISRAILADAIALTRGDRFFTTDMTAHNYTSWGLQDCSRDTVDTSGFGSMLGRLFLRTLPGEYDSDSVYTWFPLQTPEAMKGFLANLGMGGKYRYERPVRGSRVVPVGEYSVVRGVMSDKAFKAPYGARITGVVPYKGKGFFIAGDINHSTADAQDRKEVRRILMGEAGALDRVGTWFGGRVREVVGRESYYLAGKGTKNVDVAGVVRGVVVGWAVGEVAGLTIKTKDEPNGVYTEQELYDMFTQIYEFIFLESDPAKEISLREKVRGHVEGLLTAIKANIRSAANRSSFFGLFDTLTTLFASSPSHHRTPFLEALTSSPSSSGASRSTDELANMILAVILGSTVELAQAMVNMVDLYLGEENAGARGRIEGIVKGPNGYVDVKGEEELEGFVREALRLDPPFAGVFREARSAKPLGLNGHVEAQDMVFLSVVKANRDPKVFPNPSVVDPKRHADSYVYGDGASSCLGPEFMYRTMSQVLRVVFSLKNLRRAPGMAGKLKRFPYNTNETEYYQYLDKNQNPVPWATSLILQYDV